MKGDTKQFRAAFIESGFRGKPEFPPIVFNDLRKKSGIRRIKLWHGDGVFEAPQFAQQQLEYTLEKKFGDRYLGGQFIPVHPRIGKWSFVIYLQG